MAFLQLTERGSLDFLFGNCIGQWATAMTAPLATQTTATTRGSNGAGNMDVTPAVGSVLLVGTPGTGATQNQYTNLDIITITASTATSVTFASQTIGKSRAVGDFIFLLVSGAAAPMTTAPATAVNTWYVGLSTVGAQTTVAAASDLATLPTGTITVVSTTGFPASGNILVDSSSGLQNVAYTGTTATTFTTCTGGTGTLDTGSVVLSVPTSATVLSNEPTATGSYARVAVLNTATNFTAASGASPATKTTGTAVTFPASSAAWSSGATALDMVFVADASTLAGGNVLAWGYLTTAQTVNASGITPSFAIGQLSWTLL